jgi:hypothetical protein
MEHQVILMSKRNYSWTAIRELGDTLNSSARQQRNDTSSEEIYTMGGRID